MNKVVFLINGKGGAGKDTVCELAKCFCWTTTISSITPILDIAKAGGWDGKKTTKSRRLLSQLKKVFSDFNDLSYSYCLQQVHAFLKCSDRVLFIHVREPEEIERLRQSIVAIPCYTLLIRRKGISEKEFGNDSDDSVEKYKYDEIIENNGTIDDLRDAVEHLLQRYNLI